MSWFVAACWKTPCWAYKKEDELDCSKLLRVWFDNQFVLSLDAYRDLTQVCWWWMKALVLGDEQPAHEANILFSTSSNPCSESANLRMNQTFWQRAAKCPPKGQHLPTIEGIYHAFWYKKIPLFSSGLTSSSVLVSAPILLWSHWYHQSSGEET